MREFDFSPTADTTDNTTATTNTSGSLLDQIWSTANSGDRQQPSGDQSSSFLSSLGFGDVTLTTSEEHDAEDSNPSQAPAGDNPSQAPAGDNPSQAPTGDNPSQAPAGDNPSQSPAADSNPSQAPRHSAPSSPEPSLASLVKPEARPGESPKPQINGASVQAIAGAAAILGAENALPSKQPIGTAAEAILGAAAALGLDPSNARSLAELFKRMQPGAGDGRTVEALGGAMVEGARSEANKAPENRRIESEGREHRRESVEDLLRRRQSPDNEKQHELRPSIIDPHVPPRDLSQPESHNA